MRDSGAGVVLRGVDAAVDPLPQGPDPLVGPNRLSDQRLRHSPFSRPSPIPPTPIALEPYAAQQPWPSAHLKQTSQCTRRADGQSPKG